jgi:hypothetical protein
MLEGKLVKNILCIYGAQIHKSIPNKMAVQYLVPTGHRIPKNLITAMTFISIIIMLSITTKKLAIVR